MNFTIKIERDEHPGSPRDWYNLGTMACWHGRYELGDEQIDGPPDIDFDQHIIMPLFIYDHSGITMSTSNNVYPFTCPWDSGHVGYIYVSKEDARKEYGWSRITKQREDRIKGYLRNEVATYDQYLTGDVYGYIIQDDDGNVYDSCWGFYGYEYCEQEAEVALEYVKEQNNISEFERVQ